MHRCLRMHRYLGTGSLRGPIMERLVNSYRVNSSSKVTGSIKEINNNSHALGWRNYLRVKERFQESKSLLIKDQNNNNNKYTNTL